MKKILSLVITLALAIALTACGNAGSQEQSEPSISENTEAVVSDSHTDEIEKQPKD